MAETVTNYQCPACTGPLHYSGDSGKLECDFCGSSFPVAEIEALYAQEDARAAEAVREDEDAQTWAQWDGESGMRAYSCPSCGAQLVCEETTSATSCPYCGNPTIVPGQFEGMLKPDFVLPFKLSREDARAALQKHYRHKLLLPKAFKDPRHLEEIQGVYVPFWLYDARASGQVMFHASNSDSHRSGDYVITETSHYDVLRKGSLDFEKVPVDGSGKISDNLMDSIEPYNYEELKEFSTAYLPGFLANKYDVSAKDAAERSDNRCTNTVLSVLKDTVTGYDQVEITSQQTRLKRGQVKYALLPVWLLSTRWKGQSYQFAMNGQTGRLVGDLPIDRKKLRLWFWGVAIGASLLLSLLMGRSLGSLIDSLIA